MKRVRLAAVSLLVGAILSITTRATTGPCVWCWTYYVEGSQICYIREADPYAGTCTYDCSQLMPDREVPQSGWFGPWCAL
jgi:hypothetical protein